MATEGQHRDAALPPGALRDTARLLRRILALVPAQNAKERELASRLALAADVLDLAAAA